MKRINFKALGILLGVAALAGAAGYLLYTVQVRRNVGKLLVQAEIAEKKDNPERAAKMLDRYGKPETSGLRVHIKSGPNELEPFRLTPK